MCKLQDMLSLNQEDFMMNILVYKYDPSIYFWKPDSFFRLMIKKQKFAYASYFASFKQ